MKTKSNMLTLKISAEMREALEALITETRERDGYWISRSELVRTLIRDGIDMRCKRRGVTGDTCG